MAEELSRQAQKLADLTAENQRLSNLLRQANGSGAPESASKEELRDLLRLRGEVGQLRQRVAEMKSQPESPGAASEQSRSLATPDPQTIQAYWPRSQLGFAGQADPVSALRTVLWAMSRGDGPALAGSVTPEARKRLAREDWNEHGESAEEIAASAAKIAESLSPSSGFYLVGQKLASANESILDVFFEREGRTRKFSIRKVEGEWKFNAMGRAGWGDDEIGNGVWP
jgi:hypothetical protein